MRRLLHVRRSLHRNYAFRKLHRKHPQAHRCLSTIITSNDSDETEGTHPAEFHDLPGAEELDKDDNALLPALRVLSEALTMARESPAIKRWTSTEWLMGLTVLAQHRSNQRRKGDTVAVSTRFEHSSSRFPLEKDKLQTLLRHVRTSDAVYERNVSSFCTHTDFTEDQVLRTHTGGFFSPKFHLVLDHDHKEIVLTVRGSASILDFVTDLHMWNEPFHDGQGHRGMVHAANWLVAHLKDELVDLQHEYTSYQVVLTGHSLGAAVAALATIRLQDEIPNIRCYGFGTAACVTKDIAHKCADCVTTIVYGDDCVPRLHQHSIIDLHDEVALFDWRQTLKDMVKEGVEDQKMIMQKTTETQIEGLRQKLEALTLVRENENSALSKLGHLLSNWSELFPNKTEGSMSASWNATRASFQMDRLALDRVESIKNLFMSDRKEDKKGKSKKESSSFWWKQMESSVDALELLSDSVNKPEELERLLTESKKLLAKTSQSAKKGSVAAKVPPQVRKFQERIDGVIKKTSDSLSSAFKDKISEVSDAVASNVHDYVESVKDEAQTWTTKLRKSFKGMSSSNSSGAKREDIESMFQALEADTLALPSTSCSDKTSSEKAPSKSELEAQEEARDMIEKEAASQEIEGTTEELMHDPLYPPGRLLYLSRPTEDGKELDLVEVENDEFQHIVLSNRMLLDHLCTTYEKVLQEVEKKWIEKDTEIEAK